MTTVSPNLHLNQLSDPIAYSAVDGTWPNPEVYVKSEIQRISDELRNGFQSDDAAIVEYVNAQFTQVNGLINGLAGGPELQQAVGLLNTIANIVDSNGDGVLDALSPLTTSLTTLEQQVAQLQGNHEARLSSLDTSVSSLNSLVSGHTQTLNQVTDDVNELQTLVNNNEDGVVNLANNLGRNLQAIRNALMEVNVNYTPIALPAPVFATTNVTGGTGETSMDPDNLS